MKRNRKASGLSELAKQDWQQRIDRLTDIGDKRLMSYDVVDEKVGAVPVALVIERAQKRGLTAFEDNGRLHIGPLQRTTNFKGPQS